MRYLFIYLFIYLPSGFCKCNLSTNTEGRKKGNAFFNDALNTFYFIVIWRLTDG